MSDRVFFSLYYLLLREVHNVNKDEEILRTPGEVIPELMCVMFCGSGGSCSRLLL